jgi:MSHA biogenesis protein MshP
MRRYPFPVFRTVARSAGVGLVTAIFLLVVLAGLGTAMVTVFTSQQASSALDEQGARAYQAARAGLEWGLYWQLQRGGCPGLNYPDVKSASTSFPLPADGSLAGFVVTVTCTQTGPTGEPLTRVVIRSRACTLQPADGSCTDSSVSNNPDFVQRVVEAEI